MIRPWYRSRLFWLGVPGLVFLIWLWADSENSKTYYSLRWKTPSYRGFGIGCQHGFIEGWIGRPYQGFGLSAGHGHRAVPAVWFAQIPAQKHSGTQPGCQRKLPDRLQRQHPLLEQLLPGHFADHRRQ